MRAFLQGESKRGYDGTIGRLIDIYLSHEDSPYNGMKATSRRVYYTYAVRLKQAYGELLVRDTTGLDVKRWHKDWRAPAKPGGPELLGAAAMSKAVLLSSLSFGVVCGHVECSVLQASIKNLKLPGPKARDMAPTAEEIELARKAAHAIGRHSAALCYALQFETVIRQWDLIGQWLELSDKHPSAIIRKGMKWVGPTWADLGDNLVLTITPTKTEGTTGKKVIVDLSLCPMVMEELALIPAEQRVGPLVANERDGMPYQARRFSDVWGDVRKKAGLPPDLWNRDLRAGGNTEAEMAGASADDRAKAAGHSKKTNTRVYSRDVLVSTSRVAEARAAFRAKKNTT